LREDRRVSVFVKICGIRDEKTAAAAVAAGADAIGFVFAKSVRQVTPGEACAAAGRVPDRVQRVAVMRHPSHAEWRSVLDEFEPDVLQTDTEDFADIDVPDTVVRWPVLRESSVQADALLPDVFVYEGADSGTGQTVDWSRAAGLAGSGRMILAGGLTPANVGAAIAAVRPWGVDVSSGVESAPGKKDERLIREFIGAVRAAETEA
jgi:phosphoribosylanthranilate isomerase